MSDWWCVLVTPDVIDALGKAEASWGWLDLAVSKPDQLVGVASYSLGEGPSGSRFGGRLSDMPSDHPLARVEPVSKAAVWYRAREEHQPWLLYEYMMRRSTISIPTSRFEDMVLQGWRQPPANGFTVLLEDRSETTPMWTAWRVTPTEATPATITIYDPARDPSYIFNGLWPRPVTRAARIGLVGVGSIGSAAAESLADYDIGSLTLIDPDRIYEHNLARHRATGAAVGRYKVNVMCDRLKQSHANISIEPLKLNVITDADQLRPILAGLDVVLCSADGVAARQATAHLCAQADTHAVFAAVLDDGALGEIIRSPRGRDIGCLACMRNDLAENLQIEPEPHLDLGYGTGTAHRPMTAIAGDLGFMGTLAAKATVSTLLEQAGQYNQRWASDHMVLGLRPAGDAAAPFDQQRVLDVTWREIGQPDPECAICRGDTGYR